MTARNDSLVADYLTRVSRATEGLPSDQRDELIRDLREHIETRRVELSDETEADVREILDRLGDPEVIARAAAEDSGVPPKPTARRRYLWIAAAVIGAVVLFALCAGVLVFAQDSQQGVAIGAYQR